MLHALLKLFLLSCLLAPGWAQALQISASRLWPSPDYTRITLESAEPPASAFTDQAWFDGEWVKIGLLRQEK